MSVNGVADSLSFSVDQFALFLGIRLFGPPKPPHSDQSVSIDVNLEIDGKTAVSGYYKSQTNNDGIYGVDVMFKSPILVKEHEVMKMVSTVKGNSSMLGKHGKSTVTVEGVTVTFIEYGGCTNRTCVCRGQFHEMILSV